MREEIAGKPRNVYQDSGSQERGTFKIRSTNHSTAVIFNIKATRSQVNNLFLREFIRIDQAVDTLSSF
jgi:hypothetical protein